jgi:hypothetical protein
VSLQPAAQEAQQSRRWTSRWQGRQWSADEGCQACETGCWHGFTSGETVDAAGIYGIENGAV